MADESGREKVTYGEQELDRGTGGETHQVSGDGRPPLTTLQGVPVADVDSVRTASSRTTSRSQS